ncbi:hypothetical protein TSA66_08630 [Noviherbaspirillum autotrophicum]|uniref:DUF4404 domain-containing protein n=2 Tax=Noviherbaspirillum autotrophicum TaxID=709839 RepID=A0A0C2BU63_9BURK|nr:hypothetical protein TSA66_08630 [Noviherbaspirillum autotrophicum]
MPSPSGFSLERVRHLVAALEQELANAPADAPQVQTMKEEIATLKHMLASPDNQEGDVRERLHTVHNTFQDMTARVESEVLRDSPYIAEIGRILGLV